MGLILDGNIFSLGATFGYDPAQNRAIAVDSRALLTVLSNVNRAGRIVSEIEAARRSSGAARGAPGWRPPTSAAQFGGNGDKHDNLISY